MGADGLSLEEQVLLTAGADAWTTHALPSAGVPALKLSDGPNGVRGRGGPDGPPSACFPVGTALAATWDVGLVAEVGRALGLEARQRAAHVLLAPTVNLHRSPLAGRNFECFSEDPHLSARMAVAMVEGVQSQDVAACVKHLVANDSEFERYTLSSEVPPRPLHELYLVPFEAAVREAGAWAVMTAYNRLRGVACSAHPWLVGELLKGAWGFDGLVVSDWGGTYDTVGPALAGLDLEMPGPARFFGARLGEAVAEGEVPAATVADKARRLVRLAERTRAAERPAEAEERGEDSAPLRRLARRAAAESMVLLRNRDEALPLALEAGQRLLVVGPGAAAVTIMGGGSSQVRPHPPSQPLDALRAHFEPLGVDVRYEAGWRADRFTAPLEVEGGFELVAEPPDEEPVALGRVRRVAVDVLDHEGPVVPPGSVLRWRGRLLAAVTGAHRFGVAVAGRAWLAVDGEVVVEVPPVRQGPTFFGFGSEEVRVVRELVAGRAYDLEVAFAAPPGQVVRALRVGVDPPEQDDLAGRAAGAARAADAAVVVVGLTADWEGEGADRSSFELPGRQAEVAEVVARICPRTVVVVNAGSPVRLDWADRAGALLCAWYPGMEAGNALVDVLTGKVDAAGRLPTTFPRRLEDSPSFLDYPGEAGRVRYAEASRSRSNSLRSATAR
ncbi:MAG: beta-glucosidase [Acidimicrobiia bacterium]|nr:beta-glucosidase [Acidimicrobiia bacterium]